MNPKKMAVLASGGDSPGMNACIRAVTRRALQEGIEVWGAMRGYQGLLDKNFRRLERASVSSIINLGGSILVSSRCDEFRTPQGRKKAADNCRALGIEHLVAIGGNGTMTGAHLLAQETGLKVIGLPGTIDNDIYGTDHTIGFDTATNTALEAIDRIRDTASAMERVFFIEVMGRDCGNIAIYAGVAGGADYVAIPEIPTDIAALCEKIKRGFSIGKSSNIVVVAEGDASGGADPLSQQVLQRTGIKSWVCKLGHIQRGGSPTAYDRFFATAVGIAAVEDLMRGASGYMIGFHDNQLNRTPLIETYSRKKPFNDELYRLLKLQD